MPQNPFVYPPLTADSNYAPIAFEVRDGFTSRPVDMTGAQVSVTIKTEDTHDVIVQDSPGSVSTSNPYVVQYTFADTDVAKILVDGWWLVEWRVVMPNTRVLVSPVYRLPVRARL